MTGEETEHAFPLPITGFTNNRGMTLRDWFAGQALAGLLASGHFTETGGYLVTYPENPEFRATCAAWACAKKMMEVRNALTACEKAQQKKLKGRAAK